MKKYLVCFAAALLLHGVMTAFAQPQSKPLPDSKSVVIGDIKITIFQVGVVAGNMKTGKVIWRDGFAADSVRNDYIVDSFILINEYVFFRKICRGVCPDYGVLLNANDGRVQNVYSQYFLLSEDENLYFDSSDPFEIRSVRTFGTIFITKFHVNSKQRRLILFDTDYHFYKEVGAKKCVLTEETGKLQTFKFKSKIASTWNFVFKNARCQIDVSFDEYDLEKYTINIIRT